LELVCDEAGVDEQWLFVGKNQINAGYGIATDHVTNTGDFLSLW